MSHPFCAAKSQLLQTRKAYKCFSIKSGLLKPLVGSSSLARKKGEIKVENASTFFDRNLVVIVPGQQLHAEVSERVIDGVALVHYRSNVFSFQQGLTNHRFERIKMILKIKMNDMSDN